MDCICTDLLAVGADNFSMKGWMTNLKDFEGVVGKWSFDANRNATKPLYAQQVQSGQFVLLERIEY